MPHVMGDDFARCIDRFAGAAPFGEDAKYDPVYQDLRAEVQKLTAHSSVDGSVDWKNIRKWSIDVLAGKSKDLTVASYLTLALFFLEGYGGMADGLEILHKYLKDDWEGIYPPSVRPRNRALALEWLVSRLAPVMEEKPPDPKDAALLRTLRERLEAFQETVRLRLLHDAPSFADLNSALSGHLAELPEETASGEEGAPGATPEEPAAASAPAPATAVATPRPSLPPRAAAGPAEPELPANAPANEVAGRIRTLVPALRQADPLAPLPYRLLRTLKWDNLAAPPPANPQSASPDTTRVPPPRPQQQSTLEGLLGTGNWAELLKASEGTFQEEGGTFWLDLQRYAALALEGLGAPRAAEVVKEEVVRLLKRLDTLPTLWFADRTVPVPGRPHEKTVERTPFATEATRQWLETLQAESAPAAPAVDLPPARATGAAEPALSPAETRAIQDLLAKQQAGAAFDRLQAILEKAPNRRARFQTRLAAARLCFQVNQIPWARTLLEDLLRESETFTFEDWEPETASDLYLLLALCYARPARKGGPQDQETARVEIEKLRRKLFRLDLRAAAALEEALKK
jgi:type VI secretion system protein VasJ